MELYYLIITGAFSLFGVWVGSSLSRRQARHQFLMEARRTVYARLLSAITSEDNYPRDIYGAADAYSEEKVAEYNRKVDEWRKNRRKIKGLATEALLVTQSESLSNKLSEFISSRDPDNSSLRGVQDLMRKEIGI